VASAGAGRDGPIASLRDVRKRLGSVQALDGLSLELRTGELLALLGPNGAGKTTAVATLLGQRHPDSGEARLFGQDPRRPGARRAAGVAPQDSVFPRTLRVDELVDLVSAHFDRPVPREELLGRFMLTEFRRRQAGGLSGGVRKRLGVALAFAGAPSAVFLDEPTTGLDVHARGALWDAVRAFVDGGGSVLLTTHYLEEAEALASRIVVVDHGRVIAAGSVPEIRGRVAQKRVRFSAGELPNGFAGDRVVREAGRWCVYTTDADRVVRTLVEAGTGFRDLEVAPASLEEAFLALTVDAP
jgi:ABC-2 type transport system ATP-binding protein